MSEMFPTDVERAAAISAAIERSNEQWHTRTSGTDSAQAFEDRRLLAAELGRVLIAFQQLAREQGLLP